MGITLGAQKTVQPESSTCLLGPNSSASERSRDTARDEQARERIRAQLQARTRVRWTCTEATVGQGPGSTNVWLPVQIVVVVMCDTPPMARDHKVGNSDQARLLAMSDVKHDLCRGGSVTKARS
jgi:hypothetical protein